MTTSPIMLIRRPRLIALMALFLLGISGRDVIFGQSAPAPAAKPTPDVVVFSNGDQLTGKVVSGAGDSIVFASDMAGQITIPLAKIKELHSNGNFALLRKDTKTPVTNVQIGTIAYTDGNVVLTPKTGGGTESVPPKNVDLLIDEATYEKQTTMKQGLLNGWKGSLTGGATIVEATDSGQTYTVATNLVRSAPLVPYLPPKNRTLFALTETYGKMTSPTIPQTAPPTPPAITKTDIFQSSVEQDEYFTPKFYALEQVNFLHDFSQGLNLEQIYGGGIGWTAIKNDKQELDLKGQLQYEKQTFQTAVSNEDLIGATFSEAYTRTLPRKIVLTESASVLPAFNDANAYSAIAAIGATLPVWKRFGLSIASTDNFLNDPGVGYKKNSFQFITGLTYTLP